jgi:uncharacterized protein YlxW (UPF0749 family)
MASDLQEVVRVTKGGTFVVSVSNYKQLLDEIKGLQQQLAAKDAEIERLTAEMAEVASRIDEIMERRDGTITGVAWGDLDNLRLDCMKATKGGMK